MTASERSSSRWAALLATTLAAFLTPFMDSATTVALPAISRDFSLDAIELSWIRTAYLLSAAMFLVPFGKLADIYGRKRIFAYGSAIFGSAALLIGLSTSGPMLLACRALQGLGGGMIFGTSVAILTSAFPPGQRGRVLGVNVATVYLGLSLGPPIGGVLVGQFGWRSIYYITALLGLAVVLLTLLLLKGEWAEAKDDRFDLPGSAVYAVALVALMYGFSRLPDVWGVGLLATGISLLAVFAWREMRATSPILDVGLLAHNRPFAFSSLAALINYAATSAVGFLLSLYLQYIQALTPTEAGLVLIAQPAVQALLSPLAGWLADRIEPRVVASIGMALTAAGLLLLLPLGAGTPLWSVIPRLALMGLGFALFSSPNMSAIMGSVNRRLYGVASGMLGTMRLVGQMLSMGITTLLFVAYIGRIQIVPQVYPQFLASMKVAFATFSALCIVGIFASLARGRIREKHGAQGRKAAYPTFSDR